MINIGTVMELYKNEVLVMTVEFDLIRVKRKPGMFLGQQIRFRKSDVISSDTRKMTLIGVAAVLVVVLVAFYFMQDAKQGLGNAGYAIIDMDINPSMEFLIDDTNIVQKVLPLNSDAENLIEGISLEELPIKEAVEKVIFCSQKAGIINPDKSNVIMLSASLNPECSAYKKERGRIELELDQLLVSLNDLDHTDNKKEYDIKVIKVEPEIKKRAAKNGLSAGRQLIFEKARNQGIDLSLEEIKTGSLSALLEKVEMDKENADNEPLTSPPLQSPEKVTSVVSPTSEQETATPAKVITPTPELESTGNKPSSVKTPGISTDIFPANTKTPNTSGDIRPSNTKTPNVPVVIGPTDGKTPDLSEASIKIQHYNASEKVNDVLIQINTVFRIINTGNTVIDLKDVSFRYYYTVDSDKTQDLGFWAEEGETSINYKFVKMGKPVAKADYYLEVGFKGGQLEPGKSTQVVVWFNKEDWSAFNQENDYSYSSSEVQEYRDWKYVTGYISGVLKWGIEP